MTSVWKNFGSLGQLSLAYRNVNGPTCFIYGNGKNQVEVAVKVIIIGKDGKPLDVTVDDLKDKVYLCDFVTGARLAAPWNASDQPGAYVRPVLPSVPSQRAHDDPKIKRSDSMDDEISGYRVFVSKYVSCSQVPAQTRISVGIDVPGVGKFDTSEDGTRTKNGPGGKGNSVFKRPNFLEINAVQTVDYSKPENITVKNMPRSLDAFRDVVHDMKIESGSSQKFNGVGGSAEFTIHPKLEGFRFESVSPDRSEAAVPLVNFNCVHPDMIRVRVNEHCDVEFVFVQRDTFGIHENSKIKITGSDGWVYNYSTGPNDRRHVQSPKLETNGVVNVCISNHCIPVANMKKPDWHGQGRITNVHVLDNYGNESAIELRLPDGEDYWPQVLVNGKLH